MSFGEDVATLVKKSKDPALAKASSWERVSLGEVAEILNGYPWKSDKFGQSGVPLIRIRDVTTGRTETRYEGPLVDGYWVDRGDLLVGMDGDFNLRRWKADRGLLNQRVCKITTNAEAYASRFLEYALPGYLKLINDATSSVTVKHLSSRTLAEVPLPLPPAAEQRRIVAKLDALTARLARARAELDRVPVLATKLSRSALDLLFGGLVNVSVASLGTLASKIGSGSTPRGGKNVYITAGVPFIRSQNVYFEGFEREGLAHITDAAAKALAGVTTKQGDVLLNITGASIGRACIVPDDLVGARVSQHVAIIRPTEQLRPGFLLAFLRTPLIQNWVWTANYGVTRQALTKSMIEGIEVPLPDLDEQDRICSVLSANFARAGRMEAEAARARALIDRLEAAILSRAFRGELVPQDPDDEPASVLLDRIRAQRAAAPKPKRGRRAKAEA